MMELLYLLLGWLLGLLSPLIVDGLKKKRRREEVARGIRLELTELRMRTAVAAYSLYRHLGILDSELLSWLSQAVEGYDGEHKRDRDDLLTDLKQLKAQSDEQLAGLNETQRARTEGVDLGLRKYSLPFLEANIPMLAEFSPRSQRKILEIRAQLEMMNQLIDQTRELLPMTFDAKMTVENRTALEGNIERTYITIGERLRYLCNLVGELYESE